MSKNANNESFARLVQTDLKACGFYTGSVDGWAGNVTRGAWAKVVPLLPKTSSGASQSPSTGSTNSARLYAQAERDKGLKETAGAASTPRIKRAILEAASWLNPDDSVTAWCGCIMGLWFSEVGLTPPSAYYRAANWLNVGTSVAIGSARKGDVVVLSRSGGNHVGLYHSHTATTISLLGGNQSNSVNITAYSRSSLRGIRRI